MIKLPSLTLLAAFAVGAHAADAPHAGADQVVKDHHARLCAKCGTLLVRSDTGIKKAADLAGKKLAVVAGTTTERRVAEALSNAKIAAEVLPFKDRDEAFKALEDNKAQALAGDKIVLVGLVARDASNTRFAMLDEDFSLEPYAFALRRGDPDFRLEVNRALASTYRSGDIVPIFDRWFAPLKPSEVLIAIYGLNSMEE